MTRLLESQIKTRERFDKELVERSYAELAASMSSERGSASITFDDIEQADGAVKACLKYCGAQPGAVPASVLDIEERMEWLCRPSGTMRREVHLKAEWYNRAFGAMVGKLDTGDAVALMPRGIRGYFFLEPGTGRKVKVNADIARHIEPYAVLFYKPLPARPLTLRDLHRFVFSVFDRSDYRLVIIFAVAMALIGLFPAWANQIAFGTVVPGGQVSLVAPIAAMLLGIAVSAALIGATRNLVMERISTKLQVVVESATFARVLSLPISFFKKYSAGDLATRISSMTMLTQELASIFLGGGLTAVLSLIYVVQIGFYTPALAIPALVIALLQAALTIGAAFAMQGYERESTNASAKLSGTVTALLNGLQKIKLAGAEDRAFSRWSHEYATYVRATYNRPIVLRALPAIVSLIGVVGIIVIYYLAGRTSVNVADYMAFNAAYGQMTAAMLALTSIASEIAHISPTLDLVSPIMEADPETAEDKPSIGSLTGGIEVSNVSFRYNENTPYIVRDLSFKVRPGEYVAIVGKSGCGKSTIMRLLLGFEKPEHGTIFYGPHNVQKIDLRSLRQQIGVVMQDGKLFMGNLASNITISTPLASIDDAWEAAEIAGIADDIRKMPMGMQTIVTEGGGGISGGQRQRLMIARAVCGKRKILMFDEATSALDNKTQKHVANSLDSLKCTRIVIAHRLSTVKHCDRILVVDDGRIAEEGTYDELIVQGGIFAELVERQRIDTAGSANERKG